jgi:small subunit ribosomal protein S20
MAITSSAKKAHRASLKKHIFNQRRSRAVSATTKDVMKLAAGTSAKEAIAKLAAAQKAIDKAAKRGILKPNTAARKKSRLARVIAGISKK